MYPLNILGDNPRNTAQACHDLNAGRLGNAGTVTLTANAASTVVTRYGVAKNDVVLLSAQTANAAAALGTTYAIATAKNTITFTHANNAQTDKTFLYVFFAQDAS